MLTKEKNPVLAPVSMTLFAEVPFIFKASMKLRAPTPLCLRAVDFSFCLFIFNGVKFIQSSHVKLSQKPTSLVVTCAHQVQKLSQLWAGLIPVYPIVFVAMLLNDKAHFAQGAYVAVYAAVGDAIKTCCQLASRPAELVI